MKTTAHSGGKRKKKAVGMAGRLHVGARKLSNLIWSNLKKILSVTRALQVYDEYGVTMSEIHRAQHSRGKTPGLSGALRFPHCCVFWLQSQQMGRALVRTSPPAWTWKQTFAVWTWKQTLGERSFSYAGATLIWPSRLTGRKETICNGSVNMKTCWWKIFFLCRSCPHMTFFLRLTGRKEPQLSLYLMQAHLYGTAYLSCCSATLILFPPSEPPSKLIFSRTFFFNSQLSLYPHRRVGVCALCFCKAPCAPT